MEILKLRTVSKVKNMLGWAEQQNEEGKAATELEDRSAKISQSEKQKKYLKKMKIISETGRAM